MSNIAKRIAVSVVLGLFAAGTPALAAETEVQIAQGVVSAQVDQEGVVRVGVPEGAATEAVAIAFTPWYWGYGTATVQKGQWKKGLFKCNTDEYAISGMCGDPGDVTARVRVVYTVVDPNSVR